MLKPKLLLHLEGLAVLAVTVFLYARWHDSWGLFAALFLVPDLAILAWLAGPGLGSNLYNAAHTYLGPAALYLIAIETETGILVSVALIWAAHIGFDRLLGFGLKTGGRFKETHFSRL